MVTNGNARLLRTLPPMPRIGRGGGVNERKPYLMAPIAEFWSHYLGVFASWREQQKKFGIAQSRKDAKVVAS
jgi:hypothetical protein